MNQTESTEERQIIEHMPYLVEVMHAIRDINEALKTGGDAVDVAENLLSDLPEDWEEEIKTKIEAARNEYLNNIKSNERYFKPGTLMSLKRNAMIQNKNISDKYARTVKRKVVTLLKEKDLLFLTKRQIDKGFLSLVALGEADQNE